MKIFPAIDIKDKKCVRLVKGDFDNKTEYEMSPVEQARKYKNHGFKNLHIVDLDGALTGETVNLDIIKDIVGKFDLKVEVTGFFVGIHFNNLIVSRLSVFGFFTAKEFVSSPLLNDGPGDTYEVFHIEFHVLSARQFKMAYGRFNRHIGDVQCTVFDVHVILKCIKTNRAKILVSHVIRKHQHVLVIFKPSIEYLYVHMDFGLIDVGNHIRRIVE